MMKNGWNGTLAALGGLTAAVALLSGLPAAKADELADLRANQQLLQQRLDQLAQAPVSPVGGLYPGGPRASTAGHPTVGGTFPRSFQIPGTDSSIRIGGTITLNALHFFNGGNPNQTTASTTNFGNNGALNSAPLNQHVALVGAAFVKAGNTARSRSADITFLSPQQSKVNVETRTPTAWGEARTFMEFDWANGNQFSPGNNALLSSNNLVPRLRFAYASLGGFLAGQANSNFSDPDGDSENINFGGVSGNAGVTRLPQVRYTMPLAPYGWLGAFSVSAEAPETDGVTVAGLFASDATSQNPTFTCTAITVGPAGGLPVGATACATLASAANPFKPPSPDFTP